MATNDIFIVSFFIASILTQVMDSYKDKTLKSVVSILCTPVSSIDQNFITRASNLRLNSRFLLKSQYYISIFHIGASNSWFLTDFHYYLEVYESTNRVNSIGLLSKVSNQSRLQKTADHFSDCKFKQKFISF